MKTLFLATSLAIGLAVGGAAHAEDAAALAKSAGCMKCHDVAKKKMGPSFKSIAEKYKGNKDAEKAVVAKIKGGDGHAKAEASDADVEKLAKWVLSM